jgi:CIC family chloride channel protein
MGTSPAANKPADSTNRDRENRVAIILSLVIGVLVGLVVVAFVLLTGRLSARMYPAGGAAWRRLVIPVIGSLVSGILLYRFFPDARGSGIPQTKFAIFINQGYLSLRTVLGKFFCCVTSLASGMALGREGPSVHIGAGIASVLARRFGLSDSTVKAMVPVGCSAALAAAFNTPIAAVLFSLEEILGDLHAPVLGSVVISSATSWMVLHLVLGDEPLFHVPAYQLLHPAEFGVYAILGVVGGLSSVLFVKLLLGIRTRFMKLPKRTAWLQPVAGGLTVGILGWFFPEVLGVGYDFVERVLGNDAPLKMIVILGVLKIVATSMCYSSGNAGGIFGPSLFIGAMTGGTVGSIAHHFFPATTANPGAYALVGMGTAFAGIIRTPLTSVIMIFELTRDYSIIVPLMISNLISFFISVKLQPEPIYEALALQEGIYLPTGESREDLEGIRVDAVMSAAPAQFAPTPFAPAMDIRTAKARLIEMQRNAWPVADHNHLLGVVTARSLDRIADQDKSVLEAFPDEPYPYVYSDHALSLALERMGSAGADALPVVSRADRRELKGIVTLSGVLAAFGVNDNKELRTP